MEPGDASSLSREDQFAIATGITPAMADVLDQGDLPLPAPSVDEAEGYEQAIEHFMEERETLKSDVRQYAYLANHFAMTAAASATDLDILKTEVRNVSDKVERQRGAIRGKDREISSLKDVLLQSARWHMALREQLAALGITVETSQTGAPALTVDLMGFTSFFDRAFAQAD
jgi:predicted RNase H-like nuclease (RuvC/YqgF family)